MHNLAATPVHNRDIIAVPQTATIFRVVHRFKSDERMNLQQIIQRQCLRAMRQNPFHCRPVVLHHLLAFVARFAAFAQHFFGDNARGLRAFEQRRSDGFFHQRGDYELLARRQDCRVADQRTRRLTINFAEQSRRKRRHQKRKGHSVFVFDGQILQIEKSRRFQLPPQILVRNASGQRQKSKFVPRQMFVARFFERRDDLRRAPHFQR